MILYESDTRSFEGATVCDRTPMGGCPAGFISAPVGTASGQLQECSTTKESSNQQQIELPRCRCGFLGYLKSSSLPTWYQILITAHFRHGETEASRGRAAPWSLTPGHSLHFLEFPSVQTCLRPSIFLYLKVELRRAAASSSHREEDDAGDRTLCLLELKPWTPAAGAWYKVHWYNVMGCLTSQRRWL